MKALEASRTPPVTEPSEAVERTELRDELWDAMMDRRDMDTSLADYADACVDRLEKLGLIKTEKAG